jgi:PKD repeat protein
MVVFGNIGATDGWFYPWDWAWGEVWPPDPIADEAGAACTWHAMAGAAQFQFAITNFATHWSQTVATNTTVNYSFTGFPVGMSGHFTGSAGATNTVTLEYVPDQPTLRFTANPTNGLVPLTVHFSSDTVDSANNPIVGWNWNFGDGTNVTGPNCSHTYTNTGRFLVTLVATNATGTVIQGVGASNITVAPPTVQFSVMPTNGIVSLAVFFTCPQMDSGGNSIVSWLWDFGDGNTFTDQSPDQPATVTHI